MAIYATEDGDPIVPGSILRATGDTEYWDEGEVFEVIRDRTLNQYMHVVTASGLRLRLVDLSEQRPPEEPDLLPGFEKIRKGKR
jgi:hypothetical protein